MQTHPAPMGMSWLLTATAHVKWLYLTPDYMLGELHKVRGSTVEVERTPSGQWQALIMADVMRPEENTTTFRTLARHNAPTARAALFSALSALAGEPLDVEAA